MYYYVFLSLVTILIMLECTTPVIIAEKVVNRCDLKVATALREEDSCD